MPGATIEMPTIKRLEWLNAFNRQYQGWLVSLDVMSADSGSQPIFRNEPLIGVSLDPADGQRLLITAGRGDECVTHVVEAPTHVWLERTSTGADAALAIETEDGSKSMLRFRAAALPETVDGVM